MAEYIFGGYFGSSKAMRTKYTRFLFLAILNSKYSIDLKKMCTNLTRHMDMEHRIVIGHTK